MKKLIFDYKEQSTSLEIFINNIEFEELDSKFLEVKESTIKVPFLMINVFPTNDGIIHVQSHIPMNSHRSVDLVPAGRFPHVAQRLYSPSRHLHNLSPPSEHILATYNLILYKSNRNLSFQELNRKYL